LVSLVCAIQLAVPIANLPASAKPQTVTEAASDNGIQVFQLGKGREEATLYGIRIRAAKSVKIASLGNETRGLFTCHGWEGETYAAVENVSGNCASFSIYSTTAVTVEVPYDARAVPDGVAETEIRLFSFPEVATSGPMQPINSFVDVENKKTVATLSKQSGRYFNGILKAGERPEQQALSLSSKSLESLEKPDPTGGIPIIASPEANNTGDLKLTYPMEFPGARKDLRPSVSVAYSSQGSGGNIAEGWSLSVPAISVETRWGVPVFSPDFETETYLFNGEQLVPEAGSYLPDEPPEDTFSVVKAGNNDQAADDRRSAALNLVPQPHRTTKLRPRKKGAAYFVLRRDEGLWRFVRYGDSPDKYRWEAWQENPQGEAVKVSYFGYAPGRVPGDIGPFPIAETTVTPEVKANLDVGALTNAKTSNAIMRWALAREKDSFGNVIDYDWMATCVGNGGSACPQGVAHDITANISDRDLYLKRVLYTGHESLEETLLRCREDPGLGGCLRKQGMYEADLTWTPDSLLANLPFRTDARSGGLVASRRLLQRIDFRFRQRDTESEIPGRAKPIQKAEWHCSDPFLAFDFKTVADPLFGGQAGAHQWLASIGKLTPKTGADAPYGPVRVADAERAIFPSGSGRDCAASQPLVDADRLVTSFEYNQPASDTKVSAARPFERTAFDLSKTIPLPKLGGRLDIPAGLLGLLGNSTSKGPFRPSILGSSRTEETTTGIYAGISFAPASKAPGVGFKRTFSDRSDQQELTLLQDVTGDGVNDLLVSSEGRWLIYKGRLDGNAALSFDESPMPNTLPFGFRLQYEPVFSTQNSGFEAFIPGGVMVGVSSGKSSSVQTVYMSDMDGDGRIDVVTPGGVFYNGSGTGSASSSVSFEPGSGFIAAGASSDVGEAANTAQQIASTFQSAKEPISQLSKEKPRYDLVRTWRAPFSGHVRIMGEARVAVKDDSLLDERSAGASNATAIHDEPNARTDTYAHRDGVILTVEKSSGNLVAQCAAGILSPGVYSPPQVPEPDAKGTWRLAGSVSVREGEPARYFLTLAGLFNQGEQSQVKLDFEPGTAQQGSDFGDFDQAVTAAVEKWNDADPALNGPRGGHLAYEPSSRLLTFSGAAGKMATLTVELPTTKDSISEIAETVSLSLEAVPGMPSRVGADAGKLVTKIFDDKFVPSGNTCLAAGAADQARSFLDRNGIAGGLLATVNEGDILYFRVHSIDNGSGDIVSWNPEISYLQAQERFADFMPTTGSPKHRSLSSRLFLGFGTAGERAAAEAVKKQGVLCQGTEGAQNLCDVTGHSLIRYRAATIVGQETANPGDLVPLASTDPTFVAPSWGRAVFEGTLTKPQTVGAVHLQYSVLPSSLFVDDPEKMTKEKIAARTCDPRNSSAKDLILQKVAANSDNVSTMDPAEGTYRLRADDEDSVFLGAGDRLCLFVRFEAPQDSDSKVAGFDFWPKDAARLGIDAGRPIGISYLTHLVIRAWEDVRKDGPEKEPVDLTECLGAPAPIDEREHYEDPRGDKTIDRPRTVRNAGKTLTCVDNRRHGERDTYLITPRVADGANVSLTMTSEPLAGSKVDPTATDRVPVRLSHIRLPAFAANATEHEPWQAESRLSCSYDPSLVERRFVLDLRTRYANEALDDRYGQRVASLRTLANELRGDGTSQPLRLKRFVVTDGNARSSRPVELTFDQLAGRLSGDQQLVPDEGDAGQSVVQSLRFVRGRVGTVTLTRFLNSAYDFSTPAQDGASPVDLPSGFVGYSTCVHPDSIIQLASAIDSDRPDQLPLDQLVGSSDCKPFNGGQASNDKFDAQGNLVRNADQICPIVHARARFPVVDRAANSIYRWSDRDLAIALTTKSLSDHPASDQLRVASVLEAQNPHGSALLAVQHEENDIKDPLDDQAVCPGGCPIDDPAKLKTLPSMQQILAEMQQQSVDHEAIQQSLARSSTEQCSADNPNYQNGPSNDDGQIESVGAACKRRESGLSALVTSPPAYTLPFAYRIARPATPSSVAVFPAALEDACRHLPRVLADQIGKSSSEPRICAAGPDPEIWSAADLMSASRLGPKDIHFGERSETRRISLQMAAAALPAKKQGLLGVPKMSSADVLAVNVGLGIGGSWSKSKNGSPVDLIDMNGDGFPDLIANGTIFFSDPQGGSRCAATGVWGPVTDCNTLVGTDRKDVRGSTSVNHGAAFTFPPSTATYVISRTSSFGSYGASTTGLVQSEGANTAQPRLGGFGLNADLGTSDGERLRDIIDVNGDGLPDLVEKSSGKYFVRLNLGSGFSASTEWPGAELFKDFGNSGGVGISAGFSTSDGAFGGGLDANVGAADQKQTMADVNGDGLLDVVTIDGSGSISARLATGVGFTAPIGLGTSSASVNTLGRTETDRSSAGGQFTITIPIWPIPPIFIAINPNAAVTAALTRQPVLFRDIDGDGLPDLVVGNGLRNGNAPGRPDFDNTTAKVVSNGLGGHGLLTKVWLATNPAAETQTAGTANYEFQYARTPRSVDDPMNRWVLSQLTVRDGVKADDADDVLKDGGRNTCFTYGDGFYDRFERRFLGYAEVHTTEGCQPASRPRIEAATKAADDDLNGARRIERIFANRTVFETGLMLSEAVFDPRQPIQNGGALLPQSVSRRLYVLVDTALSSKRRFVCHLLRDRPSDFDLALTGIGYLGTDGSDDRRPQACRNTFGTVDHAELGPDPVFDIAPRRLTPALVQVVQEIREGLSGADQVLRTAVQYRLDEFARPVAVCDLGEITGFDSGHPVTKGAVCAEMQYDAAVRPSFAHGGTGGGTILVDQKNLVKTVRLADFKAAAPLVSSASADISADDPFSSRQLRYRTASYDARTGAMTRLCEFADPSKPAVDACMGNKPFPETQDELRQAAQNGITMRAYGYDRFGNLSSYVGPMGSLGSFVAKSYLYDHYLNLVETSEQTDYCSRNPENGSPPDPAASCLGGQRSIGPLVSSTTTLDYRHAVATTTVDDNQNVLHFALDPLGRPAAAFGSWADLGPSCSGAIECAPTLAHYAEMHKAKPQMTLRLIARMDYLPATEGSGPSVVVERLSDKKLYSGSPWLEEKQGAVLLPKRIFADQLGQVIQDVTAAKACRNPGSDPLQPACAGVEQFVASGLVLKDRLNRAVAEYYPSGLDVPDIGQAGVASPAADTPHSSVLYDGLGRPDVVNLPDGNAYDFQYKVAASLNADAPMIRHRTEMRNAFCVPSAVERDVHGTIRTVVESYTSVSVENSETAALGSSGIEADQQQILKSGLVKTISSPRPYQQIFGCQIARGEAFQLGGRVALTSYERDALGQLVAVRLPNRHGAADVASMRPSADAIYVAYDALGRRVAIDDPDRGFERMHYDPIGNTVCSLTGPRRAALSAADLPSLSWGPIEAGNCPNPAREPGSITRITEMSFIGTLPKSTRPRLLHGTEAEIADAARRTTDITYGAAEPEFIVLNQAGRAFKTADAAATESTQFDALGHSTAVDRVFSGLTEYGLTDGQPPALHITQSYDTWGLLAAKRMTMKIAAKDAKAPPLPIDEEISYAYTPAGQIESLAQRSGPDNGASQPQPVVSNLVYDARGNQTGSEFGTGVVNRTNFDAASNRLLEARSQLASVGIAAPAILFQNLTYKYDPAGNLSSYSNAPRLDGECGTGLVNADCSISDAVAKAAGLLIRSSDNAFAYDQLNRIRSASKRIQSTQYKATDPDGRPQVMDPSEIAKAKPISLAFNEIFAFDAAHQMSVLGRETRADLGDGKPSSSRYVSTYVPDSEPLHAPEEIRRTNAAGSLTESTDFGFDQFGRMTSSICKHPGVKGCWPDRYFTWNVDDTLKTQIVEKRDDLLPEVKKKTDLIYYDLVQSEYDHAGRRLLKQLYEHQILIKNGVRQKPKNVFVSDTLYADPQLTITRRPGQPPQALVHYFTGAQRIASKWIGDDMLFTYHAQQQTRNVTDIVVAKIGHPDTARLHAQAEYAAFGEVVHEREVLMADLKDGQTSRDAMGLPQYRFNAKELDESGLEDFGARFYDGRLAIWLMPDPILKRYLNGEEHGGVFSSSNLASYNFGWGNPVRYIDEDGRAVVTPMDIILGVFHGSGITYQIGFGVDAVLPTSGGGGLGGFGAYIGPGKGGEILVGNYFTTSGIGKKSDASGFDVSASVSATAVFGTAENVMGGANQAQIGIPIASVTLGRTDDEKGRENMGVPYLGISIGPSPTLVQYHNARIETKDAMGWKPASIKLSENALIISAIIQALRKGSGND
ncbi:hypothetical protein EOA24_03135, partial [Mesorhizobium sp. M2A.F.Ca.ET.039.01.1.1]